MKIQKTSSKQQAAPVTAKLLWIGGDVGHGVSNECFFIVQENEIQYYWTITETLARINEFSDASKARILFDCAHQAKQLLIIPGFVA